MALAHAAGIGLALLDVPAPPGPSIALLALCLVLLWKRPWPVGALMALGLAGILSGDSVRRAAPDDCRLHLPRQWDTQIEGRFLSRPARGTSLPFRIERGAPGECRGDVRAVVYGDGPLPPAGRRLSVRASWEGRSFPRPEWAEYAGILRLGGQWRVSPERGIRGAALSLRGRVQDRILQLWGPDTAPVVEALVLARREHLDDDLREAFALSGTAHLLAISGFHVGVVAAILLGLLRMVRLGRRPAELGAAAGCWLYVLGIGAPDAAVRAAVILSLLAASRLRGRPVVAVGALGTAMLFLLAFDPGWLGSIGFQLSFAGTAGLVLLREPVAKTIERIRKRWVGTAAPGGRGAGAGMRILRGSADGISAGIAATLPTLPLVAWHFDRVSLLGIPATLLIAPVVAVAIPGIAASLLLSVLPGGLGAFLAGGTGLLLEGVSRLVLWSSRLPGASIWVARGELVGALAAGVAVHLLLRIRYAGRIRPAVRRLTAVLGGAVVMMLLPVLPLRGALELHVIDVGQGDAAALRFPSGRWMLVDAGPRSPGFDAGARRVLPYLRRQGADELEAVVLTHPHLDHIGGAPALLGELDVRGVLDPSRPVGSADYMAVLRAAGAAGSSWWRAREGQELRVGEVRMRVLHPDSTTFEEEPLDDANDLSVVLLVEWGRAAILLTGDAPASVERRVLDELPPLTVLKVGHHGSRTSTARALLEASRPEAAVIPAGDGNRFGHPHPEVVRRLHASGTEIYRTDRDGDIRFTIRSDGSMEISRPR